MVKLKLTKTGKEVKFGDVLEKINEIETSFGTIKLKNRIAVNLNNLSMLIDAGIIMMDCSDSEDTKESLEQSYDLGMITSSLARKYNCSVEKLSEWLDETNKICPKAVLDLLLNEISYIFYYDNPQAFDNAETYYSLRPRDGKVGKVVNINKYVPLFKSAEEAEIARKILKKQLDYMYGE